MKPHVVFRLAIGLVISLSTTTAAAQECGHPVSSGATPTASDALFTLRAGVGIGTCDILVCDVDASCSVTATDALVLLRVSVGQQQEMNCAAGCLSTTTSLPMTTTTMPAATWTEVLEIFDYYDCTTSGCHGSGASAGSLGNLDNANKGHDELVNEDVDCNGSSYALRVVPGNPDASFLVKKLEGTYDCGTSMPIVGDSLLPSDLAAIRSWIAAGAIKD